MKLHIKRIARRDTYTIGKLYIDGLYFCDTCEDCDRGLRQDMPLDYIKHTKVYGVTAIPTGNYKVILSYSPKFKKILPAVLNVPGFEGIRIHSGNTADDSLGCILVGENKVKGRVINSRVTMDKLMERLDGEEKIELTVE